MQLVTTGTFPTTGAVVTQVVANITGTTAASDLVTARLYYSTSGTFSTATSTQFGSTVFSPTATLTFTGSQVPASGTVYFYLVYNVASGATPSDIIDAQITSVTVGGTAQTPTVTAPPQSFTVVAPTPLDGAYTIDKNNPTDIFSGGSNFNSFADAFSALNNVGIKNPSTAPVHGVQIYALDGQTFTESNLVLNQIAGADANQPILFSRDGSGATAPILSAAAGVSDNASTGARDAIIKLNGTDFVTFDQLTLVDPATNSTAITRMEYGIVMLRTGTGATLNGCNNNTIQKCSITLQRANTTSSSNAAIGIASLASTGTAFNTVLSASGATATGQSSNNKFYGNIIRNVNTGIYLIGLPDASPYSNYDQGNDIGGTTAAPTGTGNTIQNFGGLVAGTTAYGIRLLAQNGVLVRFNTIQNTAGSGATPTVNTPLNGILYEGTAVNVAANISSNIIDLGQGGFAGAVTGLGISASGNAAVTINSNLFTYGAASGASGAMTAISVTGDINNTGTLAINLNQFVNPVSGVTIASSGSLTFINDGARGANVATINDNTFKNISKTVSGGTVTGISVSGSFGAPVSTTGSLQVLRNFVQIINLVTDATNTAFTGISIATGTTAQPLTLTSNTVSSITVTGANGTVQGGDLTAFNLQGGGPNSLLNKNTATIISGNGNINGFSIGNGFQTGLNVADNLLGDFTTSQGNTVYGMNIGGGLGINTYQRNKIFKLIANGSVRGSVNGFYAVGTSATTPLTLNLFNNLVGNLQLPNSVTTGTPLAGIYVGLNILVANVFHNTVYINNANVSTTSGAGVSTGLFVFATTTGAPTTGSPVALDLRNNIVVNTSTVDAGNANGRTFGFQRSSTITPTNYLATSNGNNFYVGTPSTLGTKVFTYNDQTISQATLANYKNYLATQGLANRDLTTIARSINFTSTVGTTSNDGFLHLAAGSSPAANGGVAASALVPSDYDVAVGAGDTRNTVTPEIGGDENPAITPLDLIGPNIQYTALGNAPAGTTRVVPNIVITDGTGVNTSTGTAPRLYFRRKFIDMNVIPATNTNTTDGWKYVEPSSVSGNSYTFTIDYTKLNGVAAALPANTVIQYFVAAQDIVATPNASIYSGPYGTPPATVPATVALTTANLPGNAASAAAPNIVNDYTLVGSFAGTITVGSSAIYPTLTGAGGLFEAINAGVVTGNVIANITSNTTEDGTNALNALNTNPVNSPFTLTIQADPSTAPTQYLLTGSPAASVTGMIRLDGVRNIIFDGTNSASSGTASRLLFQNTNTANNMPTFQLINDANNNIIRNCIIESGNASSGATGTILFGNGVANGIGNSFNQIIGNEIRQLNPASNVNFATFPGNGIYSAGLSTLVPNRQNVVQNNSFTGYTNAGIYLNTASEQWTIGSAGTTAAQGNRLYQIGNLTTPNIIRAVQILGGTSDHIIRYNSVYQQAGVLTSANSTAGFYIDNAGGNNLDISFNTVGGANASGTGNPMQLVNTTTSKGNHGFYINVGTTVASSVQGNTVKNTQISTTAANTGNFFYGFQVAGGLVNFGTVTGNFVGDSTATLGIKAGPANAVIGMFLSAPGASSVFMNNRVRNITAASTLAAGTTLTGINMGGSNFYTVDRNQVKELLNGAPSNATAAANTFGFAITNSNANLVVRRNKISDIRHTFAGANTANAFTEGISTSSAMTAGSLISENTLWNISSDALSNTGFEQLRAIENSGSATFANNRVSITGGSSLITTVFGVLDLSTGTPNFFYNSLYISGSSSSDSYVFYRSSTTTTATVRNNIFYNDRTGAGGAFAIGAANTTSYSASTSDYNYLVNPNAAALVYYNGASLNLTSFQQATGGDQRSNSQLNTVTPATSLFVDPTYNLKIKTSYYTTPSLIESLGTPVAITTDFEGQTRPGGGGTSNGYGTAPDIGADEYNGVQAPVQTYSSSTVAQITAPTFPSGTNQAVVRLGITVVNSVSPLNLNSLDIRLNGTTSLADLVATNSVKVYYTGLTPALDLSTATLYGTTDPLTLSGVLTIAGSQLLSAGTNYFFLTYDLKSTAVVNNVIDGEVTSIRLSGVNYTPSVTAPTGNRVISGPMTGNYLVGTALGTETFATITDAFANVSGRGVSGAVTLTLTNSGSAGTNAYSTANGEVFPLVLNPVTGASATNTITLKPNTSTFPVINGSVAAGAVLKLNGAKFFTVDGSNGASTTGVTARNLTINNIATSGTNNAILWVANNATTTTIASTNNMVKNVALVGNSASGTPQFGVFVGGSGTVIAQNTVTANSTNVFDNVSVQRAFYGFFFQGVSATVLDQSNEVRNSSIGLSGTGNGLGLSGITAQFEQNMNITGNDFQNIASNIAADESGITLVTCKTAAITRNSVHDVTYQGPGAFSAYGILVRNATAGYASTHLVANNFVYNITSPGSTSATIAGVVGIGTSFGTGDKFYNNTVSLSGTVNGTVVGSQSAAFANGNPSSTTATTNVDVRNNIFSNTATSTVATNNYAHYTTATTYTGSTLNYNDLYVATTGAALGFTGRFNANDIAVTTTPDPTKPSLWATAVASSTGAEANSKAVDPKFISATNLHLSNASPLDNSGVVIAAVTNDIDGDTRPGVAGTAPDMGADEFSPPVLDLGISALLMPGATNCYSGTQPVQVTISNFGATALTNTAVPVRVTITPPTGPVQTLDAVFTGSIAAGGTANFTVGNYTATVSGTYSVVSTTLYGNDPTAGNNALTSSVMVSSPTAITVTASPTGAVCSGSMVTLTAASTASPAYSYTWTTTTGGVLNTTTGVSVTANPTQTATYTVTGNNGSCSATQTITITVNPLPAVTVTPSATVICSGNSYTIAAQVTGTSNTVAPNLAIPDNNTTGIASTIALTAPAGVNISNSSTIKVTLNIAHTWNSDLYVYLVGPGGTGAMELTTANGGSGRRYTNTVLVTGGGTSFPSVTTGTGNFTGTFSPEGNSATALTTTTINGNLGLTAGTPLNGLPINGTWTLRVYDRVSGDVGTLENWSLEIADPAIPTPTTTIIGPGTISAGVVTGTTTTFTVTNAPNGANGYTLQTTDGNSCVRNSSTSVTVNPRATATLSNNGPIGYGNSATVTVALTGTAPYTFTYTKNGGSPITVTATSTNPYTFSTGILSTTATYQVTALTDANCGATAADLATMQYATTVIVNGPPIDFQPTVLVSPSGSGVCYGSAQTVVVRVKNVGSQPIDFSQPNSSVTVTANVSGVTAATLTGTSPSSGIIPLNGTFDVTLSPNLALSNAGNYNFIITTSSAGDPNTGNNSLSAVRTIPASPVVTATATPATVCSGSNSTLSVTSAQYQVVTLAYAPYTVPGTGATTLTSTSPCSNSGNSCADQGNFSVPLPFAFTFFGTTYAAASPVFLVTNGYVSFGTSYTADTPGSIPTTATPNGFIAGDGRDLNFTAGSISYFTTGTAPNRTFVIYYNSVPAFSGSVTSNFQIALHETTNVVDIISVNLASATRIQGIESADGTQGFSSLPATANASTATTLVGVAYTYIPYSFSWSPSTFLSSTSGSTVTATAVTANTTYTVTATNPLTGCQGTTQTTVTVQPLPTATLTNNGPVVFNNTAMVTINLTGAAPWTFTYTDGTTPTTVTATSTNPYIFTTPVLAGTTTYSLTALSDASCTASAAGLAAATTTIMVSAPAVDYAAVSLVSPGVNPCYNTPQTVTVRVRNAGSSSLNFATQPLTVTVNVTGTATQSFTQTLTTGTLATNATIDVSLPGTLTMTTVGAYNFAVNVTTTPSDPNPGNNTLTAVRTVAPLLQPTATASPAAIDAGSSSTLSAAIQPYGVNPLTYAPYTPGTATVTTASGFSSNDDGFLAVTLPFSFNFFGNAYTSVNLETNGYLSFGTGYGTATPANIPTAATPNNIIAGDMHDLNVTGTAAVKYYTLGTAPNRTFVVSYENVPIFGQTAVVTNFQIALHETTNVVDVVSVNIPYASTTSYAAHVQGVENSTGTLGFSPANYGTAASGWSAVGVAYSFTPNATTGTAGFTFNWLPGNLSGSTVTVYPTTTTTYTVTGTNTATGCSTAPATVTVNVTPDVIVTTVNSTPGTPYTIPAGTYHNVVVQTGGTATITGAIGLTGNVVVQDGATLNTGCQPITGSGRFEVQAGGTLGVCNVNGLTLTGTTSDIQMSGLRSFSNDANYVYNGTAAQTTGSGLPTTVRSLSVANAANVALSQAVAVRRAVNLSSGNLTTTATNNVTLLSVSGQGTALVNNGTGTGVVTGSTNVMQRAVDVVLTGDNIGYHHYSSPMTSEMVGTLAAPGFAPVLNDATSPSFNTAAQVGYVRPFPTVFGYDQTRVGSTQYAIDQSPFNQGYFAPANALAPWVPGKAYSANVPNAVVVDFQGQFNNSPAAAPVAFAGLQNLGRSGAAGSGDTGWQLLGNPFPSPLNLGRVPGQSTGPLTTQTTNLDGSFYQYHSTSRYGGYYNTYLGTPSGQGIGNDSVVAAGGGFFMRVTAPGTPGSLNLTNANRITSFDQVARPQPVFGRAAAAAAGRSLLTLVATAADGTRDALTVYAQAGATAGVDPRYDALKLANPNGLNLAARAGNAWLAIDGLPAFAAATVVPLSLGVPAAGTYTLEVAALANFGTTQVWLRDAATGADQLLSAGTQVRVAITNAATATTRYALVFGPAGALATAAGVLATQVSLYPNPAHGRFTLQLPPVAGQKEVHAALVNALGQVVQTRTIALAAAGATAEFGTTELAQGVYLLRLQAGSETATQRVVVE